MRLLFFFVFLAVCLVPTAGASTSSASPEVTAPDSQVAPVGEEAAIALGSFTDTDGDGPYSFVVSWGDGSESRFERTEPGPIGTGTHTYAARGTVTVSVEVTDAGGAAAGAQFTLVVAGRPHADAGPNQMVAEDTPITLEGTGTSELGQIVEYRWRQRSGPQVATTQVAGGRLSLRPPAGTYSFELVVDDGHLESPPDEVTLWIVNRVPEVSPPPYQRGHQGLSQPYKLGWLSDAGGNGAPWRVTVDWGDGSIEEFDVFAPGELPAREHSYSSAGTFWVLVKATDYLGAAGGVRFRLDVAARPPPPPAQRCVVPRLIGMTVAAARRALAPNCALGQVRRVYSTRVRRGRILSQAPRIGARLTRGAKVRIVVSRGRR
jgi:hypothetical protein